MNWIFSLYVAFLFFILTPAILVRLPPKAGKLTVAGFHAVVFALILHFTGKIVWNFSRSLEGFQEGLLSKGQVCNSSKNTWTDLSGNPVTGKYNMVNANKGICTFTKDNTMVKDSIKTFCKNGTSVKDKGNYTSCTFT